MTSSATSSGRAYRFMRPLEWKRASPSRRFFRKRAWPVMPDRGSMNALMSWGLRPCAARISSAFRNRLRKWIWLCWGLVPTAPGGMKSDRQGPVCFWMRVLSASGVRVCIRPPPSCQVQKGMCRAGRKAAAGRGAACRGDGRFGAQSGSGTHQAETACSMMNIGYGPTKQTISLTRLFKWIMTRQMEIRSCANRDIRMQKWGFARGGRL